MAVLPRDVLAFADRIARPVVLDVFARVFRTEGAVLDELGICNLVGNSGSAYWFRLII